MNIHTIGAGRAAAPARKPRRPKSVRPRFKCVPRADTSAIIMPPAVGGETLISGRDEDAIRADLYAREGHPLAMLVRLRIEAARHVEALLAFLDATEGDVDLADDSEPTLEAIREAFQLCDQTQEDDEDGADHEPWLGFPEPLVTQENSEYWWQYFSQDARQDIPQGVTDDRELDESDLEPSLCGVNAHWVPCASGVEDGEQEADDEPSLGSVDPVVWGKGQELWAQGDGIDLEDEHDGREPDVDDEDGGDDEEHEPSGIADLDGLVEQWGYPSFNTKVYETLGEAIQIGSWSGM